MKTIIFEKIRDFDPAQTFDCGQCFRWEKIQSGADSTWRGIVGNRVAEISHDREKNSLEIRDSVYELGRCTRESAQTFWHDYLDLGRNYGEIKRYLVDGGCTRRCSEKCTRDKVMEKAVKAGGGIRILNQNRWETLVSFIISQNNNIPRIKKCIKSVAETLGTIIEVPGEGFSDGGCYYSLPSPEVLAKATVEDLASCRLGYRDKYLIETAKQIVEGGYCVDSGSCRLLECICAEHASCSEAIEGLRRFSGVGPKVANCVALFCLGQVDSFPLDVWMKRVMNSLYGIPENDLKAMKEYAEQHFAPYGGIAQQYLFYYITHRSEK